MDKWLEILPKWLVCFVVLIVLGVFLERVYISKEPMMIAGYEFGIPKGHTVLEDSKVLNEKTLLQAPDHDWGRKIDGSSGMIAYYEKSQGVFNGRITLRGLERNHSYSLSIEAHKGDAGYDNLQKPYGKKGDRYTDVGSVTTDDIGNAAEDFKKKLPAGNYEVEFHVEDNNVDNDEEYKSVLYYEPEFTKKMLQARYKIKKHRTYVYALYVK